MKQGYLPMTSDLHSYVMAHSAPLDAIQSDLIARTEALGDVARWQTAPEQSAFLTLLVQMLGARRAVEIGTFTGLSALAIARGLPPNGTLVCCEISDEWSAIANDAWTKAGVADRIDLRIGPADRTLAALPDEPGIDFAFIDADKRVYWDCYTALVGRMRPGGAMVFDNVLRRGRVLDPRDDKDNAIVDFNARLAGDERVDVVMLPVADGMSIARRRD